MTSKTKNLIGYLLLGPFYACARNYIKNGLIWGVLLILNTVISVKFNNIFYSLLYLGAIIFASLYLNKLEVESNTIENKTSWLHVIGWAFVYLFSSAVITTIVM